MTTLANNTTTWAIDPAHAELGFAVRHLMLSTVRGRFGAVSGTITVDEKQPTSAKIDVTVDVASVDTRQEMRQSPPVGGLLRRGQSPDDALRQQAHRG